MAYTLRRYILRSPFLYKNNIRNLACSNNSTSAATIAVTPTKNESSPTYTSHLLMENDLKISEMKHRICQLMGLYRGYKPLQNSRTHLLHLLPDSQDELPVRKINDSSSTVIIPLEGDKELQESYTTMGGNIRLGKLLEVMDEFSVWVSYKHILNPRQKPEDHTPYVIVTLLVDRIMFTSFRPKHDVDIRLSGHVSWVGKSSIEVMVGAEQYVFGNWEKITEAVFLMAARNSTNDGPAVVNKLVPETDSEKTILLGGESRKNDRIKIRQSSLLKVVPDADEQKVIHDLFLKTVDVKDPTIHRRVLPSCSMWMDDHIHNSIIYGHPVDRNIYDKIFGGFLMRNSLELAWMSACLYSKYHTPRLLHISDINFRRPISVGAFINMHAHVVYTEHNYIQIAVFADVLDPMTNETFTTNSFQYTFHDPVEPFTILPRSYSDAMLYIDGRRQFQHVMSMEPKSKL